MTFRAMFATLGFLRYLLQAALIIVALGALAACGSGSSGSGGATPPEDEDPGDEDPGGDTGWNTLDYSANFDSAEAQNIAASSDYTFVDYDLGGYSGHPYTAARIHVAMSAGLTGKDPDTGSGLWVQVVEGGSVLSSHEVFAGTTFDLTYDTGSTSYHPTHVASLIGANAGQMTGVAPDVNLVLSSGSVDPTYLANSVNHAASLGAVAQNNSWGYTNPSTGDELLLSEVASYMTTNGTDAYQALTGLLGSSNSDWQAYISALDNFQNSGVVVWALSNDDALSDVDATAAFGVLFPDLAEAYVTVANALVNYTTSSDMMDVDITNIYPLSVVCGSTAHHCITADGTTWGAEAASNTDYATGTGTSYAAPIVAGSVALIAEAFPNLSPEDWTKRLLASGNMDLPGFTEFGTVDFGNGVVKPYDWQYGHGFLDVAAALSPIGTISRLEGGDHVDNATRIVVDDMSISAGSAFGDAFRNADIVLYDALNGDFEYNLARLGAESTHKVEASPAVPRLTQSPDHAEFALDRGSLGLNELQSDETIAAGDWAFGLSALDGHHYIQDMLGLTSENVAGTSVLSLAEDTTAFVGRYDLGFGSLETFGFIGTHSETVDGMLSGTGGTLSLDFDPLQIKFGATQFAEQGSFLGLSAADSYGLPGEAAITTFNLAASTDLTSSFTLFGGIEYGVAFGNEMGGAIVDTFDPASFSGFQVGARATDLWLNQDRLTFTASQPLRVEAGTLTYTNSYRDPEGNLTYDTVTTSLAPSGRQLDLGLSYAVDPNPYGRVEFGLVYSLDAGHVSGAEATAVGATFTQAF